MIWCSIEFGAPRPCRVIRETEHDINVEIDEQRFTLGRRMLARGIVHAGGLPMKHIGRARYWSRYAFATDPRVLDTFADESYTLARAE